tara:strand:+ start:99610 stop:100194 length:585 start_codon:yes stop_codon:yes gene_type:complete
VKSILISLFLSFQIFAAIGVGESASDFKLTNQNGDEITLSQFKGKIIVLEWMNHGCPFVKKHYNSGNMQKLQKDYRDQVVWLSIISSSEGKQGYSTPDQALSDMKEKKSYARFVLIDQSGDVGHAYGAKTTPHMFIIGKDFKIKYEGAIDSIASTDTDDIKGAKNYVKEALDNLMAGKEVAVARTKSYGCSVKY